MDLSLVLPCYNEEPILEQNLKKITGILSLLRLKYELILVDDASNDSTRQTIARFISAHPELPIKAIHHENNKGRGAAFMSGVNLSSGKVVGFFDIDLEVSPVYLVECLEKIADGGYDLVVGKRHYKESLFYLHRAFFSACYSRLVSSILGIAPGLDTESGYKFFLRSTLLEYNGKFKHAGWFWDTEVVSRFFWDSKKIASVPCLFIRNKRKKSSVKLVRDTLEYLAHLVQFKVSRIGSLPFPQTMKRPQQNRHARNHSIK